MSERIDELLVHQSNLMARYRESSERRDLDEAVDVLVEVCTALDVTDPRRAGAVEALGRLLFLRYFMAGRAAEDRDRAIECFQSLQAPERQDVAHLALGLLLFFRAVPDDVPLTGVTAANFGALGDAMARTRSGPDLDGAIDHLQRALDGGTLPEDIRGAASALSIGAQLVRTLVGGGTPDLGSLLDLVTRAGPAMGSVEPVALRAWLLRDPAELTRAVGLLEEGHPLRPALLQQLTLATAAVAEREGSARGVAELVRLAEQTLAEMPENYPSYEDAVKVRAGARLTGAGREPTAENVERAVELAREVLARSESGDPIVAGKDHFLVAMALTLRAQLTGDAGDRHDAAGHLRTALTNIPPADPLAPTVFGMLASLLSDRHLLHGVIEDADAATFFFRRGQAIIAAHENGDPGTLATLRGLSGLSRAVSAIRRADEPSLVTAVDEMRVALDGLPQAYLWRSKVSGALGLAQVTLGLWHGDVAEIRAGMAVMDDAVGGMEPDDVGRVGLLALGGLSALLAASLGGGERDGERAIALLTAAVQDGGVGPDEHATLWCALGIAQVVRGGDNVAAGITCLEHAERQLAHRPGNVLHGLALRHLAEAYHRQGELDGAIRAGLGSLRAYGDFVLLQSDVAGGLTAARGAAQDAQQVARWCLAADRVADALVALELGRGLVLHAATTALAIPELLRDAGHPDLATEWETTPPASAERWTRLPMAAALDTGVLDGDAPDDLRFRVLAALRASSAAEDLSEPPSPAAIGRTLAAAGFDVLTYLVPSDEGRLLTVDASGTVSATVADALRVDAEGPLATYATAEGRQVVSGTLAALCDWAWHAAIAPLREKLAGRTRVVLVPSGVLGTVPWHAARRPDGRYACQDLVISYASSARQLIEVAARERQPVARHAVFVANPLGDQDGATFETMALRRMLYPNSIGLGDTADPADGDATPAEVLAHLPGPQGPGASLLQLSCHARIGATPADSCLSLTQPLPIGEILRYAYGRASSEPGGLVVLSACTSDLTNRDHDEVLTLATAFLAAGAATVVGSRWEVSDRMTPPLMFAFHHFLVNESLPPVDALRATQVWLLDPHRPPITGMPDLFVADLVRYDFTDVGCWAAFTHQGR